MLSKVRSFIKDRSPDWLNVEVNKDFFKNFSAARSPNQSLSEQLTVNDEQSSDNNSLVIDHCSLLIEKGKPHWRRTLKVFEVLDQAPPGATYTELINYVREVTGTGCSRKLISKWKKERQKLDSCNSTNSSEGEKPTLEKNKPSAPCPRPSAFQGRSLGHVEAPLKDGEALAPSQSEETSLSSRQVLSYVAATVIMAGLVGCNWLLTSDNESVAASEETVTQDVTPPVKKRPQKLEPRKIKISLTLSSPQDLKVKPGQEIKRGQVLSDRTTERTQLLARKKQLELTLEKLNLPLPDLKAPKSIPEVSKLPSVSYIEEEANIKLKFQELKAAEMAIANQQEKISQLKELNTPPEQLEVIIAHEQSVLEQLETAQTEAQTQLEITQAKLNTAKEQRAYAEYQRQLEETKRAIALSQQQADWERQQAERAQQLQEREYSKAQIKAQIQSLNAEISQLSTVKAPYDGTLKKIKWTGQSDHTLTAELTLAVTSAQSTAFTVSSREPR